MESRYNLLLALLLRELKNRYQGSIAGALWLFLQPLLLLAVYALVFGVVFRPVVVGPSVSDAPAYVAIIATALWPWLAFSEAIVRGMTSVQAQAGLVKKVAFPAATLVLAAVLASFTVHMVGAAFVLAMLALGGVSIQFTGLVWYGAGFATLLVPALGLALLLAGIHAFVRDTEQVVQQLMTLGFYATPVLYTADMLPAALLPVVQANPVAAVVEAMRIVVLGLPAPMVDVTPSPWIVAAGFGTLLGLGAWVFARLSPHFEDAL